MKATSIQNLKLNIINKIVICEDKALLQKVWDIISTSESSKHIERVFTKEKEATIKNLKVGLKEVELLKQGKLKTTSTKDFFNEL